MAKTKLKVRRGDPPPQAGWKGGARFSVRPEVAAKAIQAIERRDGIVTPLAVVDAARSPSHPLHAVFNWDDTSAAEKWRAHQARLLINAVRVTVTYSGGETREQQVAFVSVRTEAGRGYMATARVMSDDLLREQAVADALAALEGWRVRYAHLTELADLCSAIQEHAARARAKKKAA